MGILEQITQMKNQGMPDEEIASKLQEQRISPKEITDAMNQSKIKSAVSDTEDMQPSIMQSTPTPSREEKVKSPISTPINASLLIAK